MDREKEIAQFCGWLTGQKEFRKMDCSILVSYVKKYCETIKEKKIEKLKQEIDCCLGYLHDVGIYREKCLQNILRLIKPHLTPSTDNGWNTTDTLPDKDGEYLIRIHDHYRDKYHTRIVDFTADDSYFFKDDPFLECCAKNNFTDDYCKVLFWKEMPIPPLPKTEGEGK
jgi:hypothetical protein